LNDKKIFQEGVYEDFFENFELLEFEMIAGLGNPNLQAAYLGKLKAKSSSDCPTIAFNTTQEY
jgi:hypothetical protein